jgi:phosphoglycolate phosphatase-like HAD superfamily hydrolase
MNDLINELKGDIKKLKKQDSAIALDFDGVCKLFTQHKHQVMRTCLFIHLYEFQRVPWDVFSEAYPYINFRSEVAGKERFLCASRLADHLLEKGYGTDLPGLRKAVEALQKDNRKISADNVRDFQEYDDVKRALEWSDEVNDKVGKLTEIGLTPGISEYIFEPFRETCDFYIVSTATEETLQPLMEKEGIDFILKYMGQETATKEEALTALGKAGYNPVFMFGDSLEDSRASEKAGANLKDETDLFFAPVIPELEEESFSFGCEIINLGLAGASEKASALAAQRLEAFRGKEVSA